MNSVKKHRLTSSIFNLTILASLFIFLFSNNAVAQDDQVIAHGKKLFKANCVACHKLDAPSIGPALRDVGEKYEAQWLRSWVQNNTDFQKVDAEARKAAEYSPTAMTNFPTLSNEDVDAIVAYTSYVEPAKEGAAAATTVVVEQNPWPMYILLGIVGVLALGIFSLLQQVKGLRGEQAYTLSEYLNKLWEGFLANGFLKFLSVIFFLLCFAWFGFSYLSQVGIDQGYQPIQEIMFSHKVHAGDNKIDCQYCHSSAKHSKTSGIPTVNVCMNCHRNITEYNGEPVEGYSNEELTQEIEKIYTAIGYDKSTASYIEGYAQQPIKWTRVHNLPDFAYFNHSQHVTVAGLDCAECHGPVEEMHEVYQYSPLTMGWCIDCHRDTEIDMTENGYYKKIHEQLAAKYGVAKVTEAQMGGLECGKCHY